ncbi:serine hydrolase domain-containing protein [Acidipropionibacterium timonense]|uniref:serine hydrolase domain-containing protein n=1 Tax=Acidipropionibacterium timonense TaxID=2161818 RepID=UPI001032158E|nr:serine hydrolase domain-containing protein [Acidipropionibacterium timonense]
MSHTAAARAVERTVDHLVEIGTRPHRLIVSQHGHVLADHRREPWRAGLPGLVYSCSKTFTSAAVGLAVADGAFDYDDLLVDLWPEAVPPTVGPRARSIRVRDALAMATGHTQEQADALMASRVPPTLDTARAFLAAEPQATPGRDFAYNNLSPWLLSRIVELHTGTDVETLLADRVLTPLGITDHAWQRDGDGLPLGFSGLHIDAMDLWRFGQLLLDDGVHEGTRLLPTEWMVGHRTRQVDSDGLAGPDWGLGYGWQVWMSRHGYRLDGAFGQFVLVLPQVDAVVVSTNDAAHEGPVTTQDVLATIWEHLWPVLSSRSEEQDDPRSDDAVAEPVISTSTVDVVDGTFDPVRSAQGILDGEHLLVSPGIDGWNLAWTPPTGPVMRLRVGHRRWEPTHVVVEPGPWSPWTGGLPGALDVAACGGWTDEGLVIEVAVVSSPHSLRLVLGPDGPSATPDTEPLNPGLLHGLLRPVTT